MQWRINGVVHNPVRESNIPLAFVSGGMFCEDESYQVERQNYNTYLLLYTMEGEGVLQYEGKEYRLLPGTAFLIDCMRSQMYRTAGTQWTFCWLHFRTDTLREYVDGLYQRYGATVTMTDGAVIESRINAAVELFRGYDPTAPHRAFAIIAELLGMLYTSAQASDRHNGVSEDTMRVMKLIEERYSDRLTLDAIARAVGHSKYYLAHQFKQDTGIAIYAYLTLFRISKAKVLLQNTNLSVAGIAEQVGFASVSNFIRTFSEYEAVTPYQYRKQWQV